MRHWFILSAMGRDRPGLVANLAQLIFDAGANLDDSRMTILGSDFAVILLCSSAEQNTADAVAVASKRLERDHGLTILLHSLKGGPRPSVPAPGTRLYQVEAAGEDRAGIVASICGVIAARGVNIVDLATRGRPGPGGSPHYEMEMKVEVPESLDVRALRAELEAEADRLVIDVALMPAQIFAELWRDSFDSATHTKAFAEAHQPIACWHSKSWAEARVAIVRVH